MGAILLSVFAVAILSIALAEEEVQVSDSDRSYGLTDTGKATVAAILIGVGFVALGGTALLQGNGNRRKHTDLGANYKKDVLNFPDNNRVLQGVSNLFIVQDQKAARPVRQKRNAPISSFKYNRDGTISLK